MQPVKIKENVYWVGAIDWSLRYFHGYLTQRGSTYNAFLIIDEKITLIDTVKAEYANEMIERISKIIDPSKIDIVISNHVEPDHSGSLPVIKKLAPDAMYVTSFPNGEKGLKSYYGEEYNYHAMKTGETLNIGKRTLAFVHTPMLHWPDNMVTYSSEDRILFSNDAFGQHFSSTERFDDEVDYSTIFFEAKKYYANIVMPYGIQAGKALASVSPLDIDIIAPSHGIIWRSHITDILQRYTDWSTNSNTGEALVVYDSMWHSTERIAYSIYSAFVSQGISAKLLDLQNNHISDVMTELLSAKYLCLGSPTLNNNILATVGAFLTYMKGLAPKAKYGLAFGSYGWSGQSVGIIESALKECGFNMIGDMIRIQYKPSETILNDIENNVVKMISSI